MKHPIRTIGGLVGMLFALMGCGMMWFGADQATSEMNNLILPISGGAILIAGVLIYNNIGNEELKDLLREQNAFLRELHNEIETGNKNAIEIARRQYQAEKRQTGSLLSRDK